MGGYVPMVRTDLVVAPSSGSGTTRSLRRSKPLRVRRGRARTLSLFRPIERAARIRNRETEEATGQTLTDVSCDGSCDEERNNGIPDLCAPKTSAFSGCYPGDGASLL